MKTLLTGIALLLLSSCTPSGRTDIEIPKQSLAQNAASLESQELKSPLNISVSEAYQEQDYLHVQAKVEVAADVSADTAVVGVVGLKDGTEVAREFVKLSQLIKNAQLKSGQTITVPLKLAANDISEFQVRCLWGNEAAAVIASIDSQTARASLATPPAAEQDIAIDPVARIISQANGEKSDAAPASIKLTIADIRETQVECKIKPCDLLYTVIAELENNGAVAVESATIAVGLYWANSGALPLVPVDGAKLRDSEQELILSGLDLSPGEKKRLEVKVDQPVPPVRGGGFVPHVRLLSVTQ